MRVTCISHGSIVPLNRRPFDILARDERIELTLIVPDCWRGDLPDPDLRYQPVAGGAPTVVLHAMFSGNGSLFRLQGLKKAITASRPDVLLVDEEPWSIACRQALGARTRKPVIVYSKQNIRKRLPFPFQGFRKAAYRRIAAAWAVGETTRAVLEETGLDTPIHIVPHGVEVTSFVPGRDEDRRATLGLQGVVIGYAGRFVEEKGITDLLDAVARLAADTQASGLRPQFTLLLVGAGPLESEIRRRAEALGSIVRLMPAVPHDEAPAIYRLMDIAAVPSREIPSWREQFGRVLVEAAATELPIVAAATGEIPHVMQALRGGGRLVPQRDPAALAHALGELVHDAGLRRRIGRANLDYARAKFSQENIAARMGDLLVSADLDFRSSSASRFPLPASR